MHDGVSLAMNGRLREPNGLTRMVMISGAAHVAVLAIVLLVPASWWPRRTPTPQNAIMITLGGAPGPVSGGLTPISSRPIQRAVENLPKVQPTRPPAAVKPEMVEPITKPRVTPKPTEKVEQAPKEARSRIPTVGAEQREGRAIAETDAKTTSNSMGLSTGGGGTGGQINLGDFCCPEYLSEMVGLINRNWSSRQATAGTPTMRFTVQRDGTITDITLVKSSGFQALDFMAQRALIALAKLPPLPEKYTNPSLTIDLEFQYQR